MRNKKQVFLVQSADFSKRRMLTGDLSLNPLNGIGAIIKEFQIIAIVQLFLENVNSVSVARYQHSGHIPSSQFSKYSSPHNQLLRT